MENGPFEDVFPLKMGIFNCYVSLAEGIHSSGVKRLFVLGRVYQTTRENFGQTISGPQPPTSRIKHVVFCKGRGTKNGQKDLTWFELLEFTHIYIYVAVLPKCSLGYRYFRNPPCIRPKMVERQTQINLIYVEGKGCGSCDYPDISGYKSQNN